MLESFVAAPYRIDLIYEDCYTSHSADNMRRYSHEYVFCETRPSSKHGVLCWRAEVLLGSTVLLAGGGGTGVHKHSLLVLGSCAYVGVGDQVACLDVPALRLAWNTRADDATVFGVYGTPDKDALIIHGELAVSRLTLDGEVVWSAGGRDIFTGDFSVEADWIRVCDFDNREYRFDIRSGRVLVD